MPVRIGPWQVVGLAALTLLVGILAGAQPAAGSHGGAWHVVERASVASDGTQANLGSGGVSLNADGSFVALDSISSNLVSGDTNNLRDVFVRDRAARVTERVSVASDGSQGAGASADPSISSDGRFVAFQSSATNLVPSDTNDTADIFVHDRQTGATERVSVTSGGGQSAGISNGPAISADGRVVAFYSRGTLVPGVDCFVTVPSCVFVHDRQTRITELVARRADLPAISADGRFIGYRNVDGGLFVRDRETGVTERVDVSSTGEPGGGFLGGLSSDGRYVVFRSASGNLVPGDTNGENDVFVRDRQAGTTERVSVASDGSQANGASLPNLGGPISGDGRFIVFVSNAPNLVPGDSNGAEDVFVHDRETRVTERASVSLTGNEGDADSGGQVISANAEVIGFVSRASNLVPDDTNGFPDIFVATRVAPPTSPMDDDFDDNSLDPGRWSRLAPPPGFSSDVSEINQRLEITLGSGAGGAGIVSNCSVSGDFDVRVDYVLLEWPASNSHGLRLGAVDLGAASVERRSDAGESYTFVAGGSASQTPTSDSNGSLRLTRTGSTLSGYYLNSGTWVLVGSGSVPAGNTRLNLDLGTNNASAPAVKAAFDNFKVNSGSVVCPPPQGTGTITIVKDAVPDDPQDFTFTGSGADGTITFSLDDDADPALPNSRTFSNLSPGSYSVTETPVAGWDLTSATCDDGSPVNNIDIAPGETVTCTFTNHRCGVSSFFADNAEALGLFEGVVRNVSFNNEATAVFDISPAPIRRFPLPRGVQFWVSIDEITHDPVATSVRPNESDVLGAALADLRLIAPDTHASFVISLCDPDRVTFTLGLNRTAIAMTVADAIIPLVPVVGAVTPSRVLAFADALEDIPLFSSAINHITRAVEAARDRNERLALSELRLAGSELRKLAFDPDQRDQLLREYLKLGVDVTLRGLFRELLGAPAKTLLIFSDVVVLVVQSDFGATPIRVALVAR